MCQLIILFPLKGNLGEDNFRFDRKLGMSTAEFEFPAYFNFFCKKRRVHLICTEEAENAVRAIF